MSHVDKIKVLMIGLLPLNISEVRGGVEAVIMNLFKGFESKNQIELMHVSFNNHIKAPITINYAPNIRIVYLPTITRIKILDYFFNKSMLKKLIGEFNPSIIHIQEITPHLLRFIDRPKKDIVVTQHGIMSEELKYAKGVGDTLKCLFKVLVERYIFPQFLNVVFISNYNRELFRGKCTVSAVIANPVNPKFFDFGESVKGNNSLLYVGVINRRKNLELVINAMAILKKEGLKYKLHVAGGYKEAAYESVINELIEKNGLEDQIKFHGWVSQDTLLELFKECDVFVLPSQQETMPVSIAEAMAQRKVVVASNVGAVSEMITNTKSGLLFTKNSVNELYGILKQLWNNTYLLESIACEAQQVAKQKFDPELIVNQTMIMYRQILDKHKS